MFLTFWIKGQKCSKKLFAKALQVENIRISQKIRKNIPLQASNVLSMFLSFKPMKPYVLISFVLMRENTHTTGNHRH